MIVMCAFGMTGCVGVGFISERVTVWKPDAGFGIENGLVGKYDSKRSDRQIIVTETALINALGQPNSIKLLENGFKVYSYEIGSSWKGVVLFLVIPIPLALPVGTESVEYHFFNGKMIELHRRYGWLQDISTCGVQPGVCTYIDVFHL